MLASPDLGWIATPQAISIFKTVSSLETLVLVSFKAIDANGRRLSLLAQEQTRSNGEAYGAASPYFIPQLFMVSSYLSLENLKLILSMYNVQAVHLDECTVGIQQDPASPRNIAELGAALLESSPGLVCVVSDFDTTSQLPCRVMFDL
ncbi:hypothetical protein FRC12_020846 [Ceratobasidium sp. 428]|nr:hypothetical protein FRC12_020846 [Ceratobasidium sp. 428]